MDLGIELGVKKLSESKDGQEVRQGWGARRTGMSTQILLPSPLPRLTFSVHYSTVSGQKSVARV